MSSPTQRTLPTEHQEQAAVIAWFDAQYPRELLFAVPNGAWLAGDAKRRAQLASKYQREGLRAGVPDLMLPAARHGFHGLFIEMKRVRGGQLSDAQSAWLSALADQEYMAVVCQGADAAIQTINSYLGVRPDCDSALKVNCSDSLGETP